MCGRCVYEPAQAETQMRMADEQRVRAEEALKFQEAQAAAEANEERLKNMRKQWSVPAPPEEKPAAAPRKKNVGVTRKAKAAGACLAAPPPYRPTALPSLRRSRRMRPTQARISSSPQHVCFRVMANLPRGLTRVRSTKPK